jgi:hypothetical protein
MSHPIALHVTMNKTNMGKRLDLLSLCAQVAYYTGTEIGKIVNGVISIFSLLRWVIIFKISITTSGPKYKTHFIYGDQGFDQ